VSFRLTLDQDQVQHIDSQVPLRVQPDTLVSEAIGLMQTRNCGSVVVCQESSLVGIFTERDALKMMAAGRDFDVPIETVMTKDPATLFANATVSEAIRIMAEGGYRRLPIVDEAGNLIAILKVSQILHYLVEHFPQYIYNLPPAPHHTLTEREGA
jgi:CBS domain-containing protein